MSPTAADDPERRTSLAEERTRLALDRTLLAWWRTALGFYALGLAIAKALPLSQSGGRALYGWIGTAFVAIGILTVAVGFAESRRGYRSALSERPHAGLVALTGVLLLAGVAVLVVALP